MAPPVGRPDQLVDHGGDTFSVHDALERDRVADGIPEAELIVLEIDLFKAPHGAGLSCDTGSAGRHTARSAVAGLISNIRSWGVVTSIESADRSRGVKFLQGALSHRLGDPAPAVTARQSFDDLEKQGLRFIFETDIDGEHIRLAVGDVESGAAAGEADEP